MADVLDQPLDLSSRAPLAAGQAERIELRAILPPVVIGGQSYEPWPSPLELIMDISAGTTGRTFRLRAEGELRGPCWRCLDETRTTFAVDSWEYQENNRAADLDEDGLDCAYLVSERLDVARWAADALLEVVPPTIVCRAECAGICAGCGADLNRDECTCVAPTHDPRWDALADLAKRMEEGA